ncbi:MAG: uridine kinase [Kiritimatiellales bacterium]
MDTGNMISGRSIVIGIAGGTGSGKSTLAHAVCKRLGGDASMLLSQDSYYKDRSDIPVEERALVNYDHPDALDLPLLAAHLQALKNGRCVTVPCYDFTAHTRHDGLVTAPKKIIVVEGILLFSDPQVRAACDIKVFVRTADDIRFVRRLLRDMTERGRTAGSVVEQYLETVRPMHRQFAADGAGFADLEVDGEACLEEGVTAIIQFIRSCRPDLL